MTIPRAVDRLTRVLAPLSHAEMLALSDRAGVDRRVGSRARYGRQVNASAYLALCAAAGIHPATGEPVPPHKVGEILWWLLGAAVYLNRHGAGHSLREASADARVTYTTLCRIEAAHPVSTENYLALCRYVGVPPDGFTGNTNCNSLKTQEAA
jgi:hypothetical protein